MYPGVYGLCHYAFPGVYGWQSSVPDPWIEVDFESDRLIGGIVTLGHRSDSTQFVKTYKIQYRPDGSDTYTEYTDAEGNEVGIGVSALARDIV